jgi:hypothetical protein
MKFQNFNKNVVFEKFLNFGIRVELQEELLKNIKIGIECGKISTHILPIYGKEKLKKFHETLNLLNKEKSNRLRFLIESSSPV